MLFRRIVLCALLIGLCSGLAHSLIQRWQVIPLIQAAEVFESAAEAPSHEHADVHAHADSHADSQADAHADGPAMAHEHEHDHAAHVHEATEWQPEDGLERTTWTVIANILSGMGYALLLLPLIAVWDQRQGSHAASWRTGALWGVAGWLCLFALPAIGLPPELPGTASAALHARQAWWLLAAACGAGALALIGLSGKRLGHWRWLGVGLPALPFLLGAPEHTGSLFPGQSAEAAQQMQALTLQFRVATSLATAMYWLILGTLSGAAVARWVRPLLSGSQHAERAPSMEST